MNKKILSIILSIILIIPIHLSGCRQENKGYIELCIPSSNQFASSFNPRCVWDLKIYNNVLYVGSGDYTNDVGPINVYALNLDNFLWSNSGVIDEESVCRFIEINGDLVIPGVDSCEDWDYGSYYKLVDNEWLKFRNVLNAVHNFDMIEFDGKLFAGLGVDYGKTPLVLSYDNGQTFYPVNMYKNSQEYISIEESLKRVYELFTFNDDLYAVALRVENNQNYYDLFKYSDDIMVYQETLSNKIYMSMPGVNVFENDITFNDKFYFSCGSLYYTTDFISYNKINFNDKVVCDFIVKNGVFYVLCTQRLYNNFLITIYKSSDGVNFDSVNEFFYSTPALSIEIQDDYFYLGMGNKFVPDVNNGMIIALKNISK